MAKKNKYRDINEVSKKFFKIEKELNLFDQKINNVHFWEYIRFDIHKNILKKLKLIGDTNNKNNKIKRYISLSIFIFNSFRYFLFKNPSFQEQTKIIFLNQPRRKLMKDGNYWDIFCDPLIEKMEDDYICIEYPYFQKHFKPAKTKKIKYLEAISFLPSVLKKIKLKIGVKF